MNDPRPIDYVYPVMIHTPLGSAIILAGRPPADVQDIAATWRSARPDRRKN